jgi:acetyl-CoA synthetase
MSEPTLDALLQENRTFAPPPGFVSNSLLNDRRLHEEADSDWQSFWAKQARELITWSKPFNKTLEWDLPFAKWFSDGELNVSVNCLDRHVAAGLGDRVAYHFEGEPGDTRTITYAELLDEVQRFAAGLKSLGVKRGDRVAIYLPMIIEAAVAMLACTRIGAAHSVVFGGFSSDSLRDRINDAECNVVITADAGYRKGAASALKPNVDAAIVDCPSVQHVVVVNRCDTTVAFDAPRDVWYHDLMEKFPEGTTCEPEAMHAEDLLFILYTSGTTAKPKGIMHTTGGYLTQVAFTHRYVFDLHPETDMFWCSADVGWVTGHSYVVYGPLANAATSVMYEGTPDTPTKDRWWSLIEKYKVTIFYTAPTAIRSCMKWGIEEPQKHDLSSLRLLGSVGEPINPEAWIWYHNYIGGSRCPIVDTWWQTETGAIMISPLPGVTVLKPGSATFPLPGIGAEVVDEAGKPIAVGGGYLTLSHPWPSMLRGIYGDPDRYRSTYWSTYEGRYFAGDGAKLDDDGYLWLLGRVDDVMNVSGHRISTTEVESALVDHPSVAEAAVVGANDELTGQAVIAFVTLKGGNPPSPEHGELLRKHVAGKIGPIAKPKQIVFTDDLPKTRSGKIMRRLLRDMAEGRQLGDTTTLSDPNVMAAIKERAASSPTED